MKNRILTMSLIAALCFGMLAGCGGSSGNAEPPKDPGQATETTDNTGNNDTDLDTDGNAGMKPGDKDTDELEEVVGVEKILEDVNSFRYTVLPESAELTGCEIVKRQTNPEDKEDIVYCRLIGPEEGFKYSQYYVRLLYNFYDEGGWILDEMTADQEDQWGVLGYLDGQGKPVEDGLVYIRDYDRPDNTYNPDLIFISNDGLWQGESAVHNMQGDVVSGLTGTTMAARYTVVEGGLVYLCDMNGNKLSAGYEEVSYAGAITDDDNEVVDHRWRVCKDGLLGFLNDAGQEVVALKYDAYENQYATFLEGGVNPRLFGKLCEIRDGDSKVLLNSDGRELVRYGGNSVLDVETYCNGYLVIDPDASNPDDDTYSGYDTDGNLLFSEEYYDAYANMMGICAFESYWDDEDQYYPDWVLYDWEGNERSISHRQYEIPFMHALGGLFYNVESADYTGVLLRNTGGKDDYMISSRTAGIRVYGDFITSGSPMGVFDEAGNFVIAPEYERITPMGGGIYVVRTEDGREALFDWQGNQRTQFFDFIQTSSENGQYFIVELDGKLYALRTPLSEMELQSAPVYDAQNSRS